MSDSTSFPQADADLMIDDLSYNDAREYVLNFLTAEKKTEKLLYKKQQQLDTWNERLAYAEQQGTPEQLEHVKRELHALIQERDVLKQELETLHGKNIILKEKLQSKPRAAAESSSSDRAEKLLSDFGQLVDVDEYKLKEALKEQDADDELAKLKAKLAGQ
ncbi:hypothetical protein CSA56_10120 [candidate division KSB3 bacterium]|uniref:Uncharacterized protein n=1 Tax=candidate division KSB3 bacterium TaxID=2044937 RepID=A0A2G6KDV4_9BACT|nr:MAG: hypothetical protein CSA56_10120 [candidate division KSB3 bacterium]